MATTTKEFPDDYENRRGIPRVQFIENVAEYITAKGMTVDTILKQFQQTFSKYKLMEHKLAQNKSSLSTKVPEIKKTIDALEQLKKQQKESKTPMVTHFGLTESVHVEAEIPLEVQHVNLWLGANVMVEYTFDEALELLNHNLKSATTNLENTLEDMAWLYDQITICEVNTSRVYNYDVLQKRAEKEKAQAQ